MPLNGSGVFTPSAADFPAVAGTLIQSSKYNNVVNDVANNGLSNALFKDGQQTSTANQPMGGFKHTGVAAAAAAGQYARVNEVQDGSMLYGGTAGGTADALTITTVPVFLAYATGMVLFFKSGAGANTGAATLQVNGIASPKAIQKNGAALIAGDIEVSKFYRVIYDGTAFQIDRISLSVPVGPFIDSSPVVVGSADATKKVRFEVDGLTTGTTRVLTVQDSDDTLVGRSTTDTLSNKTLASGTIATTQTAGDNSTKLATTAYIDRGSSGASLVLLATGTASASATLDFTSVITDTYDSYMMTFENIAPATDAVNLLFRGSTNNGSSFLSGTEYNHSRMIIDTSAPTVVVGAGAANTSEIALAFDIGNAANESLSGTLFFHRKAAGRFMCDFSLTWVTSVPNIAQDKGGGFIAANAVNAVRLLMSSGNIASGTARLYGMRAS